MSQTKMPMGRPTLSFRVSRGKKADSVLGRMLDSEVKEGDKTCSQLLPLCLEKFKFLLREYSLDGHSYDERGVHGELEDRFQLGSIRIHSHAYIFGHQLVGIPRAGGNVPNDEIPR